MVTKTSAVFLTFYKIALNVIASVIIVIHGGQAILPKIIYCCCAFIISLLMISDTSKYTKIVSNILD